MALVYEFTVAGKRVTLKRRLPLKDGHALPQMLFATRAGDLDRMVDVLRLVVESWGFDGDPSDAASYADLDVFADVWPLWRQVDTHIDDRLAFDPKASAPTSSRPSPSGTASSPKSSTS